MKKLVIPAVVLVVAVSGLLMVRFGRPVWFPIYRRVRGSRSVAEAVDRYGPAAEGRLRPVFERAGVAYPPTRIALLAFKAERRLELWADRRGEWVHVRTYPILAASGHAGPKLREGDRQVPEGLYRIVGLNPNSAYHLSMKLDYPNAFDREQADRDGRADPGSDIFIHGQAVSIGCLAMGNEAIEELFVLTAKTGKANVSVLIAPNDLRAGAPVTGPEPAPPWVAVLYETLKRELAPFVPKEDASG